MAPGLSCKACGMPLMCEPRSNLHLTRVWLEQEDPNGWGPSIGHARGWEWEWVGLGRLVSGSSTTKEEEVRAGGRVEQAGPRPEKARVSAREGRGKGEMEKRKKRKGKEKKFFAFARKNNEMI